mgnify:FL=1
MPVFEFNADNEYFVGLRDDIGQIIRWPEADFLGHKLEGHNYLEFKHLDATHFVVGKEADFKPDMVFVLNPPQVFEVQFDTNFEPNDGSDPASVIVPPVADVAIGADDEVNQPPVSVALKDDAAETEAAAEEPAEATPAATKPNKKK